ncbi:hypothetical protein HPP92_016408 [Vanilla planifolia]|uniref:Uncharacterized protein n=1 Tax=Vanilla planifolia TaxID=51239 RepID=A0A835US17_VANPL|nr:hypothetical protein HPP92_016408 [Vanilla planifolia]
MECYNTCTFATIDDSSILGTNILSYDKEITRRLPTALASLNTSFDGIRGQTSSVELLSHSQIAASAPALVSFSSFSSILTQKCAWRSQFVTD